MCHLGVDARKSAPLFTLQTFFTMKKKYFQIMAVAIILFATWMYMRNSIWGNPDLYPDELLMIYGRDSSSYFIALRFFFVAMWGWAVYLLWTSGKSVYTWISVGVYAAFLLVDNWALATHYQQFKVENQAWESSFPVSMFIGIPEAVLTILFNVMAVWMLKKGRKRRQLMGEIDLSLNVPA